MCRGSGAPLYFHFALAPTTHESMADTATAHTSGSVRPRQSKIPTKVVHKIVSHVVASFLDDLFEGPLALDVDMDVQIGKDVVRLQTQFDV